MTTLIRSASFVLLVLALAATSASETYAQRTSADTLRVQRSANEDAARGVVRAGREARSRAEGRESARQDIEARSTDTRSGERRADGVRTERRPAPRHVEHRPPIRPRAGGVHVRPNLRFDHDWPWEIRRSSGWSPLYRYRQVVRTEAGWENRRRDARLDVRTYYRHRVRDAGSRSALLDVTVERIEIYENGFFIGEVRRIPDELRRVRATIDRFGDVRFDRELFIVGDPYVGFELVSARHYGGFILDRYDRRDGYRAGRVDFRRDRVVPVRRSRFFDPYDFTGFVPVELLPENDEWLIDYGRRSPSGRWYGDYDPWYYGPSFDLDDYYLFDDDRTHYRQTDPRGGTTGRSDERRYDPLEDRDQVTYRTEGGVDVRIRRESTLERVE